ncbi:ABC transporter ATP-binding protein [Aerococcaceae bacterium DSM 111022]|nr:ABC transporter ATP-binding protein [Aerococcaceae bacterium DSM 111022]
MKYIWKYLKHYPKQLVAIIIATVFTSLAITGMPTMLARMIDEAIIPGEINKMWPFVGIMVLIVLLGFAGRAVRMYMVADVVNNMVKDMRNDSYDKMMHLSHHEFQELGVPSLTNRITTDAFMLLQFTEMTLKQGLMAPIMLVVSFFMIFTMAPELGWRISPAIPVLILFVTFIALSSKPLSERQQKLLDSINRILRESITGLRVVRAFNRESFWNKRFNSANEPYRDTSIKLQRLLSLTMPMFALILDVVIVALIWFGAEMIDVGTLQVGDLVAFIEYVFQALFSMMIFAGVFMMYPRASVSAGRLQEIEDQIISVENPENPVQNVPREGTLEFRNVDFMYPDATEPVLENISFVTKPGETTAFIGSTGSGKSTIVKLVPRFYDVTSGEILVNGVNIKDYDLDDLRSRIGFTPQKALLFKGKISDNLRYGKFDADEGEMETATNVAQAGEFIGRLPERFDSLLSEGGTNLSGGQKQRLSIARSIIDDREIYIFDDSFSALDYKTDAKVRAALKEQTQDASTIIVAQRVGTIMNADQIIVLDHGKVSAIGTHEELLKNSDIYYEIASSQLSEEELKIEDN